MARSLTRQLLDITRDPPPGCAAGPIDDEDLYSWQGCIHGPSDTCYAGGIFELLISFPIDYPWKPPKIVFTTKIYHPYINDFGSICCDILAERWCPALTIAQVLLSIQSLLSDFRDLDDAINPDAAHLYRSDISRFWATAREWTSKYAFGPQLPGVSRSPLLCSRSTPRPISRPLPSVECIYCHYTLAAGKPYCDLCIYFSIVPPPTSPMLPTPSDTSYQVQSGQLAGVSDTPQSTLDWERSLILGQVELQTEQYWLSDLTGKLERLNKFPSAHGGYADIWICTYPTREGRIKVGVKAMRSRLEDESHTERMHLCIESELLIRKGLCHPNILPLFGVCRDFSPFLSLVSPWMKHGHVNQFLSQVQSSVTIVDKLELLREVCSGLHYLHLHDPPIVHGDLKGANVLIDDAGHACLADFGLSRILEELSGGATTTSNLAGSIRWMAPELIIDSIRPTVFTDMYAFGSLMLEVLAQCIPYHSLRGDTQVIIAVNNGETPERPDSPDMQDDYWSFIQKCWSENPQERPTAAEAWRSLTLLKQQAQNVGE